MFCKIKMAAFKNKIKNSTPTLEQYLSTDTNFDHPYFSLDNTFQPVSVANKKYSRRFNKRGQGCGPEPEQLHFHVIAEEIAVGKVNLTNEILKQKTYLSITAIRHCCQETYSLPTGLNTAVSLQVERSLFKLKIIFLAPMKCLRIRAQVSCGQGY